MNGSVLAGIVVGLFVVSSASTVAALPPGSTSTSTSSGPDVTVEVGEQGPAGGNATQVRRNLGDLAHVYSVDWRSDGSARIFIKADRPQTLTFSDACAIDLSKKGGTFFVDSFTVPQGKSYVVVEASKCRGGARGVAITGGDIDGGVWVSNGKSSDLFPDEGSRPLAFGSGLSAALLAVFLQARRLKKGDANKRDRVI